MKRHHIAAAALALAGVAALVAGFAAGPPPAAVAPVPIQKLGLPAESVEPFREFVASLPRLSVVGAAADADNQRRRIVLDSHLLRVGGGQWPFHGPQKTGDCAAFALAAGVELDIALQSETDPSIVWRPVDRPAIYGGGRVTIGKSAIRGEGLVPAWGLQYIDQRGILWADETDVGPYTGQRSDEWGRTGVPPQFLDKMKPHAGLTYARCDSAADVCNAIASGHPVPFGSMRFGTSLLKMTEGRNVAVDNEDWPHAQLVTGYDGTLPGQRLFRILNSWGPSAHAPRSTMPGDHPGGYYVTWETMDAITREGMTFAISGSNGFRQREFVPDFSVIGAAAPPAVLNQEPPTMFPPEASFPLFLVGGFLLAAALAVLVGNARRRGLAAFVALLAAALAPTLPAQEFRPDWETLTRAAQPRTPETVASGDECAPRWELLTLAAQREPRTAAENVLPPPVPPPQVTIDVYAPRWCSTCPQWKANLGDGDRDLRYRWHTVDPPAEITAQTRIAPTFVRDGKLLTRDPAGMTHADFRRLVGLPAVRPSAVASK